MKTKLIFIVLFLLSGQMLWGQFVKNEAFKNRYALKEVVVLSRHNIRSPLSTAGSLSSRMTPHKWHEWSAGPSQLTLKGGVLETMMGQFFRKWLVNEGLMEENHEPGKGEFYFYANSMQRTIATAQYFSSGMLPVANIKIEHRYKPSRMDSVFYPKLHFMSERYKKLVMKQIEALGGKMGLEGYCQKLSDCYPVLEKVLDCEKSESKSTGEFKGFKFDDTQMLLPLDDEPNMTGSLKIANTLADALVLQYYEEPDTLKAAFGHNINWKDWEKISKIKDIYCDILFTVPAVSINLARPLLECIGKELAEPQRKFAFLCGHDSNICSVLSALGAFDYELPETLEKKAPIGGKVVFEKWLDRKSNKEYVLFSYVYQSTKQLRNLCLLDLNNPPMIFPLKIKGIATNEDGLILMDDLQGKIQTLCQQYDKLKNIY